MKNRQLFILISILIIGFFFRFYKLGAIPLSLSWDEASVGFDAWSILKDGKDQWGEFLPIVFKSFGEYKYPLHIYATSLSIFIFGYTDFAVRSPSALLGVINIGILFFLTKRLSRSINIALLSALFMAILPWHIHFSRLNWETNFTLFFFLGGFLAFLKGLENKYLLPLAYALFGISLYTYNAPKIFVPLFLVVLNIIYLKSLLKYKLVFGFSIVILLFFLSISLINPKLSGVVRFQQVAFETEKIQKTLLYSITHKYKLGQLELIGRNYASYFDPQFLFLQGDKNPRHSIQTIGMLYIYDILLLPFGIYTLLKKRTKENILLLCWFLFAPIPGSITKEAPHSSRAMFALGGWQVLSAVGASYIINLFRARSKKFVYAALSLIVFLSASIYSIKYFIEYPNKYLIEWQYPYKQTFTQYKDTFNDYNNIYISDTLGEPYIFALHYLQYDPQKFRAERVLNSGDKVGFSLISQVGKFHFIDDSKDFTINKENTLYILSNKEKLKEEKTHSKIELPSGETIFSVYSFK